MYAPAQVRVRSESQSFSAENTDSRTPFGVNFPKARHSRALRRIACHRSRPGWMVHGMLPVACSMCCIACCMLATCSMSLQCAWRIFMLPLFADARCLLSVVC